MPSTFNKGMSQDISPKYQGDGTYRYALNATAYTKDGDQFGLSNEIGTKDLNLDIPNIIGDVYIGNQEQLLFSAPDKLYIFNSLTEKRTAYTIPNLNFSLDYPVTAIFKISNKSNRLVYFRDDLNPYRVVNLDKMSEYTDAERLKYTQDFTHPCISSVSPGNKTIVANYGGELLYGNYSFYMRYLDKDLNPTFKFNSISNYIPIGEGLIDNASTSLYNGASNVKENPFYSPTSNKCIHITPIFADDFPYYQLAVVKRTSDSGAISGVDILTPTEIANTFVYAGNPSEIYSPSSIEEILTPDIRLEKVKAHTFKDNRLVVGNLSYDSKDYSNYQRLASPIKVTYTSSKVNNRNAKSPDNYQLPQSVLRNEVYSLGIVYVHKDGSESPTFHIPGRPSNIADLATHTNPFVISPTNWDTDTVTGADVIFPSKNKRWQVYNTASLDPTSTTSVLKGFMGYHECDTATYEAKATCDGHADGYWGRDFKNNLLAGSKVRHHRMPPNWLYKNNNVEADAEHYSVYIKVESVTLPPDCVGYYIVYGDRTNDKTILDKGYLKQMSWSNSSDSFTFTYNHWAGLPIDHPTPAQNKYYAFVSPDTVYKNKMSEGTYLEVEKIVRDPATATTLATATFNVPEYAATVDGTTRVLKYSKYHYPQRLNYLITDSRYIDPASNTNDQTPTAMSLSFGVSTSNDKLENRNISLGIGIVNLGEKISIPANNNYAAVFQEINLHSHLVVSIKSNRDVFKNLSNITYKKLSTCIHTASSAVVIGGDIFVPYVDTFDIFYDPVGDIAYGQFQTTKIESSLNAEYRMYSSSEKGRYTHFRWNESVDHQYVRQYLSSKYYEAVAGTGTMFKEDYTYNPSFSFLSPDAIYSPPPFNYDFCTLNREDLPHSIFYSEVTNSTSRVDGNRRIRPNNVTSIDGKDGKITCMFDSNNRLYTTTESTLYFIPTSPQELITNEDTTYIGTGKFMSIPPKELKNVDYPQYGLQDVKSLTITPSGAFYYDAINRVPVLLQERPQDLSKIGMYSFFNENGQLFLSEQIKKIFNLTYYKNYSIEGVGINSTYDPRFNRIILTKTDYELLPQWTSSFSLEDVDGSTPDGLYFDGNYFYNVSGVINRISLTDPNYFRNRSFTLSFSLDTNSWTSFHSYLPDYYFNDYNTFYSFKGSIHKHNEGNYQRYYNRDYPHILDLIIKSNPLSPVLTSNVVYTQTAVSPSDTSVLVDDTFTHVLFYNSTQSSTKLPLVQNKPFAFQDDFTARYDKTDKVYKISEIRDRSNQQGIFSTKWDDIKFTYPIDKIPNPLNINLNNKYKSSRFRDFYLGARFYYQPSSPRKLTTDILTTITQNKTR